MSRGKRTTLAHWRRHFTAQIASGLSAAEYRRRKGIRSGQWSYWQKRSRLADNTDAGITLIPLKIQPPGNPTNELQIHLPNGISVTCPPLSSPESLLQTLYRLGSS